MKTPTPFSLPLAPMPASQTDPGRENRQVIPDGFVDDEVIASITRPATTSRTMARHQDLALSADENDFAGWNIHTTSPFRVIADREERDPAPIPEYVVPEPEPGIGLPHKGGHRWWVAAATGMSSAILLAILFTSIAIHSGPSHMEGYFSASLELVRSWLGSLAP